MSSLHLTIHVGPFRTAFGRAAAVAPSKSPRPVLQNVKLIADDSGQPTLTASDLELGLIVPLSSATVLHPGSCLLPTRIGTALASLPADATLDISVDGDNAKIHLSTKGWKCAIVSEDPDLFPVVPGAETGDAFASVAGGDLKTAIQRTSYAQDDQSTRYALGGSLAERDVPGSSLLIVATDGRRLVRCKVPADYEAVEPADPAGTLAPGQHKDPVLSKRFLDLMAKLIDTDAVVGLRVDSNRAAIATQQGWALYGRLVEGRFPAWRDVFSDEVPVVKATVNTADFVAAVQRVAAIACSDESRALSLKFVDGGLELSSNSPDRGESDAFVPLNYEGDSNTFGLSLSIDHRYLAETLKSSAPESMQIRAIDNKNPMTLWGDSDSHGVVIMPLSV